MAGEERALTFGLVAGEASGDNLGGPLVRALAARAPAARFAGIAGPRMSEAGCEAWYPSDALAVMGLAEILRHLPRLLRLRRDLLERLVAAAPDAFIANNAAVTRDVPPYVMTVGQPAAAHSVNSEGLKRRGFTPEQIRNIRNAFRLLYRSGLKLADATAQLEALAREQPEIKPIVEFLPTSTRSIVR